MAVACLPLSCLGFRPPHEQQHSAAGERGGENRRVRGVPSPALRDKAEAYARKDCRGVGEYPDEPSRHASGSRRRLLSGRDTQKRLRTVDEKAYRHEWQQFHRKRRGRRHRPECGYGRRRASHAHDAGAMCAAAKESIRRPARDDHSKISTDYLEDEAERRRRSKRESLGLHQQHYAPVERGKPHRIDKEIGDGDRPHPWIAEDMAGDVGLVGLRGLRGLRSLRGLRGLTSQLLTNSRKRCSH